MNIEIRNVSKNYDQVKALNNVNLNIKSGEIHGLLGGNGSGKSTLIKIISGLISKDSGDIYLDGKELSINNPKSAKKLKIISTAQELSLLSNLTIAENITLCNIPTNNIGLVNKKKQYLKAKEVLSLIGLEERINQPVVTLSSNEMYMVEFAKAIYQDFDILMLDEITSALYANDVEIIKELLNRFKKEDKIIIFVSHRMNELFDICDSITVMRNGEIIETNKVTDVTPEYLLSLMIGNVNNGNINNEVVDKNTAENDKYIKIQNLKLGNTNKMISLDIKAGQIIGVAGLQGHGQSLLVRSIFGLYGPREITIGDKNVVIKNPRSAVKNKIAFISGDRETEGAFRQHSIEENLNIISQLLHKDDDSKVDEVLKLHGVKYGNSKNVITSLSGGNQQKVIVGRWTKNTPVLLLADDLSKGIDVQARKDFQEIFKRLAKSGMAIIFVSSDEDELVSLCSNYSNSCIIIMYENQIVECLTNNDIIRSNIIKATLNRKERNNE